MFLKMVSIAGILFVLLGSCHGIPRSSEGEPKVLIIGAGMAGITVAKTLDMNNYTNFLVIEGSSGIGGRMKSVDLSGDTVDLGALWVYGKGSNPVYHLLKQYNITVVDDPGNWTVKDTSGNDITSMADEVERRFLKALKASEEDAKTARNINLPDFTLSSGLKNHGWNTKDELEQLIETVYIDWEFTVPPRMISGKHLEYYTPAEEFKSKKSLVINDKGGYMALAEEIAECFMNFPNDRIVFDQQVTKIKQDVDGVVAITADGTRYRGDYVVVTASLGVLQDGGIQFNPELPQCKQKSINKFGWGTATIIYMKFPTKFWENTFYLLYANGNRGQYVTYQNINFIHATSNILRLGVVWPADSFRIRNLSDRDLIKDILKYLRRMYPDKKIPFPDDYVVKKWAEDPLFRGCWSYWPPSFTEANMADLQAPYGRVYFAGEHYHPVHYGYVHGAYMTGNKTAFELIECLTDPNNCPPSADDYFECSRLDMDEYRLEEGVRFG